MRHEIMQHASSNAAAAQTPAGPDVQTFAGTFIQLMNDLLAVLEQETELVRAGRLKDAAELGATKTALSGLFMVETVRLKSNGQTWFAGNPAMLVELQRRHDLFRALLQINLTVLATAHAVAESLIRGAAGDLARKSVPQGYGASGYAVAPPAGVAQPVAFSKAS